jgi:hypothetical protein
MIVPGADTDKRSHTVVAVAAATGELLGEQTVQVGERDCSALTEKPRSASMRGSATLAIALSSTSMNWTVHSRASTAVGR